jgi:GntR family transcriptional regulator of arabinose operon
MSRETSNKADAVFMELERRLANGSWQVGERIPTEIELAEDFHCSRTTVSKAITRLSHAGLVARRTRDGTRVLRAAMASSSRPRLEACAFIYPNDRHEGIWRTVLGFQQAAFGTERRTLMLPTGSNFRKGAEIVGRLDEFDVKGAVLLPVIHTPQDHDYYVQMIHTCRFPIVLAEINLPGVRRPAVVPDGFHAGYTVTRHLLNKGLTKIGFLANFAWASLTRDKYLGYRQAMEEAGHLGEGPHIHQEFEMTPRFDAPLKEPTEVALRYLEADHDVQAVVCSNDFLALGLIAAAKDRGIHVPEDLEVVGIDDFEVAAPMGLTTYRIPYEEVGSRAFALLDSILNGEPNPTLEIQVRGSLVIRRTA